MALLSSLKDPFVGANLNTALMTQFTGGSATMSYGNGASVIFPATTSSSTDGDLSSVITTYDMTANGAFINVTSVTGSGAASSDCSFRIKKDATNYLQIQYEAGTLYFQKVVLGANTNITNVAYNPTVHAWWGIFELGGTTYWTTSPDGLTWATTGTGQTSQANPITVTSMGLLIAGTSFGVDTSPKPFTFRYLNTPISEGIHNHLRVGDGMGRSEVAN